MSFAPQKLMGRYATPSSSGELRTPEADGALRDPIIFW